MKKAPTRVFSWLKAPTSSFTFKTLLRHYAKISLTIFDTIIIRDPFNHEKALIGAFSVIAKSDC